MAGAETTGPPRVIRGRKAFGRAEATARADYMSHHVSFNKVERAGIRTRYDVMTLIAQIRTTDPNSPKSLKALFRLDSLMKANWFFNSQMANLFLHQHGDLLEFADLDTRRKPAIRAGLSRVSICTTLPQLLEGLDAAGVEAAAERFVALDQRLFDVVTTQVPDVTPLVRIIRNAQIRRAVLQPA